LIVSLSIFAEIHGFVRSFLHTDGVCLSYAVSKRCGDYFLFFFFTSHGQHIILQCFTLLGGVFHMVISWSYLDDCSKPQSSPSHKSTLEYCSYIMLSPYMTHMTHLVYKFTKLTTCKICQAPSFPVSRSRSPARLPPRPQLPKSHPSRALRALRRWEARRGRGGRRRP
jgi:hypothetical protein